MTNVASILWKRLDMPGHDVCKLARNRAGWRLDGAAAFLQKSGAAQISYSVQCNSNWAAISGLIRGFLGPREIHHAVQRPDATWTLNGVPVPGLEHLVDLDLSFTPATNLTQIRRVALPLGEAVAVPVAWFDLESGTLAELPQTYKRRAEKLVWYEAPTVGYQGLLELDEAGFVSSYPNLWQAEASHASRNEGSA